MEKCLLLFCVSNGLLNRVLYFKGKDSINELIHLWTFDWSESLLLPWRSVGSVITKTLTIIQSNHLTRTQAFDLTFVPIIWWTHFLYLFSHSSEVNEKSLFIGYNRTKFSSLFSIETVIESEHSTYLSVPFVYLSRLPSFLSFSCEYSSDT